MATVDLKDVKKIYPSGVEAVRGVSIAIPRTAPLRNTCWSKLNPSFVTAVMAALAPILLCHSAIE